MWGSQPRKVQNARRSPAFAGPLTSRDVTDGADEVAPGPSIGSPEDPASVPRARPRRAVCIAGPLQTARPAVWRRVYSQPASSAIRAASTRLRAPSLVTADAR
ncbi:hypothetical protein GCM10010191_05410 [Actinomadura vinacea]|uniref:Uncharacterized protein n=1 Tax=Actinomadura vinacea TaxID=115336 RepID=A0ABN3ICS0_9ACTN